jgi:hypothetical protein
VNNKGYSDREELVEQMARILPEDGADEAFDGFFLARSSKPVESVQSVYQPTFCFVIQGGKRVLLGVMKYSGTTPVIT